MALFFFIITNFRISREKNFIAFFCFGIPKTKTFPKKGGTQTRVALIQGDPNKITTSN